MRVKRYDVDGDQEAYQMGKVYSTKGDERVRDE
jgi:hypothetical protein